MAGVFAHKGAKRFSIDDAFEEENDEAIKIYGSTTERSPLKPKSRRLTSDENIFVQLDDHESNSKSTKLKFADDTLSRDSDSLIHDGSGGGGHASFYSTGLIDSSQVCWHHPKIKENWKMVLAAVFLLIFGTGLIITGVIVVLLPSSSTGLQGVVFFVAGFMCFIPGAYHVVYIYLAVKGTRGYDFYHLPLFNMI